MQRVSRGIMLSASLLIIAFLFALSQPSGKTSAYTTYFYTELGPFLRIETVDKVTVNARPDGISHFFQNAINTYIETNNYYGYDLFLETDSTDLVDQAHPEYKIPNLTKVANMGAMNSEDFDMNTWGLSITESNSFVNVFYSNNMNIPLKNYTFLGSNSTNHPHDNIQFGVGSRIDDTIPSGTYSTSITITAVPRINATTISSIEYLHQMNTTVRDTMVKGQPYKLRDIRDGQYYYVMRSNNNSVAMVQNLDFDLAKMPAFGYITTEIQTYNKNIVNVRTSVSTDPNDDVYVSGGNIYRDEEGNETVNNNPPETPEEANDRAGGYYSYAAAILNSRNLYDTSGGTKYSICPKNWHIPTYQEASTFNSTTNNTTLPWSNNNGYIGLSNSIKLDEGQIYWTADTNATAKTVKAYSPGNSNPLYIDARNLASVRCFFGTSYGNTFNLIYDENRVYTNASNATYENGAYTSTFWTSVYHGEIPGYTLIGFSYSPNSTRPDIYVSQSRSNAYCAYDQNNPYYYCTDYINLTLTEDVTNLYAVFSKNCNKSAKTIDEAVCMQDMNSSVRKSMVVNEQYRLRDYRDNQYYWIARLPDDTVWMTQNLNYTTGRRVHRRTESNVGSVTITTAALNALPEEGFYMKNGKTKTSTSTSNGNEDQHYNIGTYYQGTPNIACPARWTIGNMEDAAKAVGLIGNDGKGVTNNPDLASETIHYDSTLTEEKLFGSNIYLGLYGFKENEIPISQGLRGKFTNTTNSGSEAFSYVYDEGMILIEPKGKTSSTEYRNIRCMTEAKGIDDLTYMQEVTSNTVDMTAYEADVQLIDRRDGKKYWVRRDTNGVVYMNQNLDLEIPTTGISFTYDDSAGSGYIEASREIHDWADAEAVKYYDGGNYIAQDNELISADDLPEDSPLLKNHVGSYYSYTAATIGSTQSSFTAGNICPKGWTVSGKTYEARRYYYSGTTSGSIAPWSYTTDTISYPKTTTNLPNSANTGRIIVQGDAFVRDWNTGNGLFWGDDYRSNTTNALYPIRCIATADYSGLD